MSTRIETYAAIGEVVSAVAVVITLAILVAGVRENTATLRASAAATSRDSLAGMSDAMLALDDEDLKLLLRSQEPSSKLEDFDDLEDFKLMTIQRAFFRRAEAQYFRYRNGLLDEDAWQTVRNRVWANIQGPVDLALWQRDRDRVYTQGFVEAIESYEPSQRTLDVSGP